MKDARSIVVSIVSLMLLAIALYAYIQAWKLIRETPDWTGLMVNIIASCMYLLFFIVVVLIVVVLVSLVLGRE